MTASARQPEGAKLRTLVITIAAIAIGACGGAASTSPGSATTVTKSETSGPETPREALEHIKRNACACRDVTCGEAELARLAAFVDTHRAANVGRVEARSLANLGVATGTCIVTAGVPSYHIADALGRGNPLELLTHIVGGMCACRRTDRTCGARHLGRLERFLRGNADTLAATAAPPKHAELGVRFNQCALRTSIKEADLVTVLRARDGTAPTPPSAAIADELDGIASAACACTTRACADKQLLALVAHVQQHAAVRAVAATRRRIKAAATRTTSCLIKVGVPTDEVLAALKRALGA